MVEDDNNEDQHDTESSYNPDPNYINPTDDGRIDEGNFLEHMDEAIPCRREQQQGQQNDGDNINWVYRLLEWVTYIIFMSFYGVPKNALLAAFQLIDLAMLRLLVNPLVDFATQVDNNDFWVRADRNRRRISSLCAWSLIALTTILAIYNSFAENTSNVDLVTSNMQSTTTPPKYIQDLANRLKILNDKAADIRYQQSNQNSHIASIEQSIEVIVYAQETQWNILSSLDVSAERISNLILEALQDAYFWKKLFQQFEKFYNTTLRFAATTTSITFTRITTTTATTGTTITTTATTTTTTATTTTTTATKTIAITTTATTTASKTTTTTTTTAATTSKTTSDQQITNQQADDSSSTITSGVAIYGDDDATETATDIVQKYEVESTDSILSKYFDGQELSRKMSDAVNSITEDKYDADDFALQSRGATIIYRFTSYAYEPLSTWLQTSLRSLDLPDIYSHGPEKAISSSAREYWYMHGQEGYLGIELSQSISIKAITVEYPSVKIMVDEMQNAPKEMELFGVQNYLSSTKKVEFVSLAHFTYDIKASGIQTFDVKIKNIRGSSDGHGEVFQAVLLRIHSNWGNKEHTKIYRIGIHGDPS
jgi:hypothetical protein